MNKLGQSTISRCEGRNPLVYFKSRWLPGVRLWDYCFCWSTLGIQKQMIKTNRRWSKSCPPKEASSGPFSQFRRPHYFLFAATDIFAAVPRIVPGPPFLSLLTWFGILFLPLLLAKAARRLVPVPRMPLPRLLLLLLLAEHYRWPRQWKKTVEQLPLLLRRVALQSQEPYHHKLPSSKGKILDDFATEKDADGRPVDDSKLGFIVLYVLT